MKKLITEQLADFTQIKLPTIYYHLDKMHSEELLSAVHEKDSNRPERAVYSVTEKGKEYFFERLGELLEFNYRPTFESDGLFYFSDALDPADVIAHLTVYISQLQAAVRGIKKHKSEVSEFIPEKMRIMAEVIFDHHLYHYQAELDWAEGVLQKFQREMS